MGDTFTNRISTVTIVTSPLSPFVTYRLGDALSIIVLHGRRHLAQAERVKAAKEFPPDEA